MNLRRREFLQAIGSSAATGLTLAATSKRLAAQAVSRSVPAKVAVPERIGTSVQVSDYVDLPAADLSGIEHIVVVTLENRSFDHFLGWLPGATGRQAGLVFPDRNNNPQPTYELAPDYEGCGHPDPDHSYTGSRTAYNGGNMDGFLKAGQNDLFAIGYYSQADQPFFSALANNFVVCDQYFASILGPTFSNRMFLWSAQTDRLGDSVSFTSMPTIFDRLTDAGVSHKYFFNNLPYLALWGLKYIFATSLYSDFLSDVARGRLPAVSFVDPRFTILDDGTGNDDHPHADIRNSEAFLSQIVQALMSGPGWAQTVLIVTFDEWGGFFEHVAPPRVVAANDVDTDEEDGKVLLGFRVPALIISPFTLNTTGVPQVTHTLFDHTSILKLIEWRWGLEPLTARDASSDIGNIATSLNFVTPNTAVPQLPSAPSVVAAPCFEGGILGSSVPLQGAAAIRPGTTEWAAFASAPYVQGWLNHPRFAQALKAQAPLRY
jgi:phospholipase C